MKYIFNSKFVNEETYSRNGEEVEIIKSDGMFLKIRFNDGARIVCHTRGGRGL